MLIVVAHPDDCDFGCAATTARWTAAGIQVSYCIATDGQAGGFDRSVPRESVAGIRRAEQTAAAAVVGVSDITFLGYPDGELSVHPAAPPRHHPGHPPHPAGSGRRPSPERAGAASSPRTRTISPAAEAAVCAVYPDLRNPFAHIRPAE